jgi:hypothetical protein
MAQHTAPARCTRTAFDELECAIPFAAHPDAARALIDAWKAQVPYSRRSYDSDRKRWRFWGGYQDLAATLLLERFPDAEIPRTHHAPFDAPARSGADHFRVLHLRETAPVELIEASYRVLARLNHPDRGGTTEAMQQINGPTPRSESG